ncbi:MAG: hypothetical protein M0024_10490 [Nitrospiraceae bacterium]|nr:hypothetical protein [Nitrospiraceae bacterium]
MNANNTKKLYEDFPDLFRGHTKSMQESLMCFGFEHNDGWFQLVYELSAQIDKYSKSKGIYPEVVQVKEKFGSLRYYVDGGDDEILKMCDAAERKSAETCENCGAPGKLQRRGGWFATLCSLCGFERGFEELPELEEDK